MKKVVCLLILGLSTSTALGQVVNPNRKQCNRYWKSYEQSIANFMQTRPCSFC